MGEEDISGDVAVKRRVEVKIPSKYKVILHNDDYTTMEFVVQVLVEIFQKNQEEAIRIMHDVHKNGIGIAGVYSKEIAETKVDITMQNAQDAGFPLLCTMEKE
ncbi:MAG: ATP-dependent Clp protease adapter ClpS [Leptospirales bacterium]